MAIIKGLDSSTQPPPSDYTDDYRRGWLREAYEEGDQYLRNQRLFDRIHKTNEMLLGVSDTFRGVLGLSDTQCNHLLRVFKIKSAEWQDTRPFWHYETFNRAQELSVRNLGNLTTSWWVRSQSDRQVAAAGKHALVAGSGVNHIHWDRDTLDFAMPARNPLDVKPLRPKSVDSYQGGLGVDIVQEMTVNAARAMFPQYAHKIKMDRDASITGLAAKSSYVPTTISVGEAASWNRAAEGKLGSLPVVDVHFTYLDDRSRNDTGNVILKGDWDRDPRTGNLIALNHWSYEVQPGDEIYPFKRLIIWTSACVLYDGPSPYWHGLFPVAKFTPNPYQDLWFGISPLWACLPLQESLNKLYRGFDDHLQVFLKPPISGDRRSFAAGELSKLDPRQPGQRWLRNPGQAEAKLVEIPEMPEFFLRYEELIRARMDDMAGVKNLQSIMGLEQIPEGETIDKMLATMTPESRAESMAMEGYQVEVGTMMAYNLPEFYDEPRVFEILGEDGLTPELYDFDPGTLVPAYTDGMYAPHGRVGDAYYDPESGRVIERKRSDIDLRPRWQRAREAFRKYRLKVEPGTLLRSASTQRQMQYMLLRSKKEIPRRMLLEELDIPNLGPAPKGTIEDQLAAEMEMEAKAMAKAQMAAQAELMGMGGGAMGQQNPLMQMAALMSGNNGGSGGSSGAGNGGNGGAGNFSPVAPEGRPNVFKQQPHSESGPDGPKLSTS
jgi:hypothetical protein